MVVNFLGSDGYVVSSFSLAKLANSVTLSSSEWLYDLAYSDRNVQMKARLVDFVYPTRELFWHLVCHRLIYMLKIFCGHCWPCFYDMANRVPAILYLL